MKKSPTISIENISSTKQIIAIIIITIAYLLDVSTHSCQAQNVIPTKGKDFWVGFPYAHNWSSIGPQKCDLFITSEVNTSGTITIPKTGWTNTFTVTANQTTTISLAPSQVMQVLNEVVENKGIEITTLDTVSVFAISFQQYTSDATVIYPKQSLGTEYRIAAYKGLNSGMNDLNSDFQIVATENGTQIEITPSVLTLGGKPAGVPFTINLNRGESYQVFSSSPNTDLTGTTIKATATSGSCRPFAVFAGAPCVNIPSGCTACDILFEQALPVANWGKIYYATPFLSSSSYTIRILADVNNTVYSINGVTQPTLNAGQSLELNNVTGTKCISSNNKISVIQYMQGISCSGGGDPSMMYLNSSDQKISNITFSTVTSTIITQHVVNVIMNSNHISQLKLDGVAVVPNKFNPFSSCNSISFAQLILTQGSHTLEADSGFSAYVYGTGNAESYAYSVGSFSKTPPIHIDSVFCSIDTFEIGSTNNIFGSWWSNLSSPTDTLGIGLTLVLTPPIQPDIYVQHATSLISGCPLAYYFNVEVPTAPQLSIALSKDTLCKNEIFTMSPAISPVASNYNYKWAPANAFINPNIENAQYIADSSRWIYLTVSTTAGCTPTVYDSVYIEIYPVLISGSTTSSSLCAGDTITIGSSGAVSYLWLQGNYTSDSISISPSISSAYYLIKTDSFNCSVTDTFNINIKAKPLISLTGNTSICKGSSCTLMGFGYGYILWMPGGSTNNSISVSPTTTTDYIFQLTGINGCKSRDTVTVEVHDLPLVSAGQDQTICMNDSATLSVTGGNIYAWTPAQQIGNTITVNPTATTNYIVTATDSNGCKNRDTVTVNVLSIPQFSITGNKSICKGDTTSIVAYGASDYFWMPVNINNDTLIISPDTTSIYFVTVYDLNGCTNTDSVIITVNQLPQLSLGGDREFCFHDSVTLTNSLSAIDYLWTPGNINSPTYSFIAQNNFTCSLEITDSLGCKNRDSIQIHINSLPIANAGNDTTICSGQTAQLNASGGIIYNWIGTLDSSATITVSPNANTNYIVEVIDSNNCISYDSVVVYVNPAISGQSFIRQICLGDQTTIADSGGVSYLWQPGGSNSNTIIVSPTSNTQYLVYITTAVGCQIIDSINVQVNSLPPVAVDDNQSICIGDSLQLTASGAIQYLWSNSANTSNQITLAPIYNTNVFVTGTDINGCKAKDSVYITVNSLPEVDAGSDEIICENTTTTITATGASNYLWVNTNDTGSTILVSPINNTTYTVIGTDSNGCINSDSIEVSLYENPTADFETSEDRCTEELIEFENLSYSTNSSINTVHWDFGNGQTESSFDGAMYFTTEGDFEVNLEIIDSNGCIDNISKTVKINPKPVANFISENGCIYSEIQFTELCSITKGTIDNWKWNFGDFTYSNLKSPIHVYNTAKSYDVSLEIISDSGCVDQITIPDATKIHPNPKSIFAAAPSTTSILDPKITFTNLSQGAISYEWDFGDQAGYTSEVSPYYFYSDTGHYQVQLIAITNFGCTDTSEDTIYITPYYTLYIPNSFTPNGDNKNEVWQPKGIGVTEINIEVFDRWGKKIYKSTSLSDAWDGHSEFNDEYCTEGVYTYLINSTAFDKKQYNYSGTINLLR